MPAMKLLSEISVNRTYCVNKTWIGRSVIAVFVESANH